MRVIDRMRWVLAALALMVPAAASAAVELTFYSREYGSHFPHAFIMLEGQPERGGERIRTNYGFTATRVTPAVLLGSVRGEVMTVDDAYLAGSDPHVRIRLSDAEFDSVMATVERWRGLAQPSYNLNRQNCVFFIAHVAAAIGMTVDTPARLMKRPRSYTEHLTLENRGWLEARGATFLR